MASLNSQVLPSILDEGLLGNRQVDGAIREAPDQSSAGAATL